MLKAGTKNQSVKKPSNRSPNSSETKSSTSKSLQEIYSQKLPQDPYQGLISKHLIKKHKKHPKKNAKTKPPLHPISRYSSDQLKEEIFIKSSSKFSSGPFNSNKGLGCKIQPSRTHSFSKAYKGKIFDLVRARLKMKKSHSRSQGKNMPKAPDQKFRRFSNQPDIEKFEHVYFNYPLSVRKNYFKEPGENLKKLDFKTMKNRGASSFSDTDELTFEQESFEDYFKTKKVFNIEPQLIKPVDHYKSTEKIRNFQRNRAARIIQKNIRRYLIAVKKENTEKLQDLAVEQSSWKETQLFTIEYLKQQEIEDIQFLSDMLGGSFEIEKVLKKTVQERFDIFSSFFKENLQEIELKNIEEKLSENPVQGRKDVFNKLIQEADSNSLKSKEQIESLIKKKKACSEDHKQETRSTDQVVINSDQDGPATFSVVSNDELSFPDLSSLITEEDKEDLLKTEDISTESILNESKIPILKLEEVKTNSSVFSTERRIETSSMFIYEFLKRTLVISEIEKVNEWISRDPLKDLQNIQNDFSSFNDRYPASRILDIDALLEDCDTPLSSTGRVIAKADKIHKKMLLSASDEVLQYFRPYGIFGQPQIWSSKTRGLNFSNYPIEGLLESFLSVMVDISMTQIGKIPTEDMILSNGHLNETALKNARNLALDQAVRKDAIDFECMWVDYEFEETQVKLDLSDIILSTQIDELLSIL